MLTGRPGIARRASGAHHLSVLERLVEAAQSCEKRASFTRPNLELRKTSDKRGNNLDFRLLQSARAGPESRCPRTARARRTGDHEPVSRPRTDEGTNSVPEKAVPGASRPTEKPPGHFSLTAG
jgi:hypothetical protein